MVPQRFVLLDALPLTPNGKVNVQALPPPPAGRPALAAACVAPRSAVETLVASVWEAVLRIEPIGIRDDFLDLGGDSLLAMRIVTRLQEHLGRELPAKVLLTETETVETMAEVIANALALP